MNEPIATESSIKMMKLVQTLGKAQLARSAAKGKV